MLHKAWNSKGEMPYCFPRSSIKFQGHTVQNITDFDPNWAFPDYRPVAAFKSLRFTLFNVVHQISRSHGLKNLRFESNLSKIARPFAAKKSLRFALFFIIMHCFMGNKTILTITDFQWNVNILQCAEPASRCSQVILLHVNISSNVSPYSQ